MTDANSAIPTLVYLFGPPAVGKMTVGQALAFRTGFRLFHDHQIIDLLTEYFEFDTPPYLRLSRAYRESFFEEAAQNGLDLITTSGWRFDIPTDNDLIWGRIRPYVERNWRVWFVELLAPLEVRLERNQTDNRRRNKKVGWATEDYLRRWDREGHNDSGGTIPFDLPLLRIDTTSLTPEATVELICRDFGLP